MEDYHVDRLEVEVWQHMELTSTNHSIEFDPSSSFSYTVVNAEFIYAPQAPRADIRQLGLRI